MIKVLLDINLKLSRMLKNNADQNVPNKLLKTTKMNLFNLSSFILQKKN